MYIVPKIQNRTWQKLHFAISNFYGVRMQYFCLKKLLHFKSEFPTSNYSISGRIWQERKGNKELPVKKCICETRHFRATFVTTV